MMLTAQFTQQSPLRDLITSAYRVDETTHLNYLLQQATLPAEALQMIQLTAEQLVHSTRKNRKKKGSIDSFLHEYDLSSEEGIALMCLAEALLRIPDDVTRDRLINDKISHADWYKHTNTASLFVNAATWSLILTGKVFKPAALDANTLTRSLKQLLNRLGSPLIRPILLQGMTIIGKQFVMGRTIKEALARAKKSEAFGYRYSYDMLGEAARTETDALHYFDTYLTAIHAIGSDAHGLGPLKGPGISVKLSALHPRYEVAKKARVLNELTPRLLALALAAKSYNIGLTVDAEEADRLELSLDIIEAVYSNPKLTGWEGFGLAIQSYQKRTPFVIDWVVDLATRFNRRIMVRLIKGAYWDAEIKNSQVLGLSGYPVFTRKNATDVSFIACAKKILSQTHALYPQFGTHNAYSVAAILELAGNYRDYEFQCLHGMGQPLYDKLVEEGYSCRIYAPVGSHKDLLGYLVRRLLENGANTSFINRIADETLPLEKIILDPVKRIAALHHKPHPAIPLPKDLFGRRKNSHGLDLSNIHTLMQLKQAMDEAETHPFEAFPIIPLFKPPRAERIAIVSPSDNRVTVGTVENTTLSEVDLALKMAVANQDKWGQTAIDLRATFLERAAELLEKETPTLLTLLCREAGKTIPDSLSEVREAVDFCRYYAERARSDLLPQTLAGPTGELNQLFLHPRGVIACISPWNFPLAIFLGQITAALAAGNAVIAKPAEQTPLIAAFAVQLLHKAGIPPACLQLLPGAGDIIGQALIEDERIAGVIFTGGTETAKLIQQALANRKGPIRPLIAETGGLNSLIVDSSALPEQVVMDVIQSSFNSAGQRCSALRVAFIQEEILETFLTMLKGAMQTLKLGDPGLLETDIGPVIDQDALTALQNHFERMKREATLLYQVPLESLPPGYFFPPCVFQLRDLSLLQREVFGPILHIIPYSASSLEKILESIAQTGYGLTLGIHSRINSTINFIIERMPIGNIYVNRNIIGAVVGVQPFGGENLSGTGPKAGGPHYLPRLCIERAVSINTTAAGGNASLVSLKEDE